MHSLEDLRAGRLRGITRLDLSAQLSEFPREVFDLADTLEVLNLTGNLLDALPDDLHRLGRLKVLFCSENRFTHLPHALGACRQLQTVGFKSNRIGRVDAQALPPNVRALILTDNSIAQLPDALGACSQLQKLMLAGNQLTALPQSLAQCRRLELLRIASNRLEQLPEWLLSMPRLAWLAYADNPLPADLCAPVHTPPCPAIDWRTLSVEHELGRGASGVIHQAHRAGAAKPVAVKLYKGAMTSDGSPLAEMSACIAAGQHPQLVRLGGRVDNHPQQLPALVMEVIDAHWSNLARPPSLDSCTRDDYSASPPLTLPAIRRIAAGIASVAAHLHACGINHGDLYAHNILCDSTGQCLLGDFGAASFHSPGYAVELLEVRAFGILLQEMLQANGHDDHALLALAERCRQPHTDQRPRFGELATWLANTSLTP